MTARLKKNHTYTLIALVAFVVGFLFVSSNLTVRAAGTLASDTFNRTVSNGWGVADSGGTWTVQTNPGNWSVAPGIGTIVTNANSSEIGTLPVSVQDVDALAKVTLRLPASGSSYVAHVLVRYQSTSSFYAVGVYQQGGATDVQAFALNGSGAQLIPNTDTGIRTADNSSLWVRAEAQGANPTTLRVRVWQDGAAEPASWLAVTTDSTGGLQAAGIVGLHAYDASSSAETMTVGSFQVNALASVDNPPTAVVAVNPSAGTAPLNVSADASGSTDTDSTPIASYTFNFGDGTITGPQPGATASHTYTAAGTYTVTTSVADTGGLSSSNTVSVNVAASGSTPTTFASDAFNRTVSNGWGSADVGGAWSGAGSQYAVTPGAATLAANSATVYNYLPTVSGQDVDMLSFITPPSGSLPTTDGGIGLRYAPSSGMFYQLSTYFTSGGNDFVALKYKPNNVQINPDVATTIPGGTPLYFRLEAQGGNPTTLRWRVWQLGTAEPASWSGTGNGWAAGTGIDSTPGLQGPGGVAVAAYVSSGTATWTVNCLVETNVAQPAPTSACPAPPPPPPPPPPTQKTYASDTFNRTVSNGWGTADLGGAWAVPTNPGNWSVAPGSGKIVTNANSSAIGTLPVNVQDVDALAKLTLSQPPGGSSYIAHLLLRYQSAGSFYAVGIYQTGGTTDVQAFALNGSNAQLIPNTDTGIRTADNNRLWVRAEAQGTNPTTLRIRVWRDGASEPASWLAVATDSTTAQQTAGLVGLHTYNASGSAETMVVTNILVASQVGIDSPPTAVVTVNPTSGNAPLNVTADASGSTDTDSTLIASYKFNFGDGTVIGPQSGATASHTYGSAGSYTITTTVTDARGLSSTTTSSVSVASSGGTPATFASDAFNRTVNNGWGSADVGGAWSGAGSQYAVKPGGGTLLANSATTYNYLPSVSGQDVDMLSFLTPPSGSVPTTDGGIGVRYTPSSGMFYQLSAYYRTGGNYFVQLKYKPNNVQINPDVATTIPGGTPLWFRLEAQGANPTTLRWRVWQQGTAEPTTWSGTGSGWAAGTGTDNTSGLQGPGGVSVEAYDSSGTDTWTVNCLVETNVAQPAPISACPSPPPPPPPPPPPSPGTVFAQDTFQRANQTHWGTASDGNVWGSDASTSAAFTIAGNTGQITSSGGTYSGVLGPSVSNAQVLMSGSQNAYAGGANSNIGVVARWTDNNNWYKAYVEGKNLVIQKKVAGTTTIVASTPFAAGGGVNYSIRFQVMGTTLQAKAWQTGTAEPSSWMLSATDSSLSSGHCGVRALTPNTYRATFTSFSATAL